MRREITTYLSTIKDEIMNLSNFIYNNPEKPYNENKCCNKITELLEKHEFCVEKNFLDIPTAFKAQRGTGHPKICYICKYSSSYNDEHIYGTNASCAMSIGGAVGLAQILPKLHGSILVLGCPGDDFNGAELTIAKQGCLEDMDIIIAPKAYNSNIESGTSMAVIPIEIQFINNNIINGNHQPDPTAIDALTIALDAINNLIKKLCSSCSINILSIEGEKNPYVRPSKAVGRIHIRTHKISDAEIIQEKIKTFIAAISDLLDLEYNISLFQTPNSELITNNTLRRLFTNNLKEVGIINVECCKDIYNGLSIGALSHTTPCINPYIKITECDEAYPSKEFGKCSTNSFAENIILKTAEAAAFTGLDVIEKQDLINEMTSEFYEEGKKH